MLKSTYNIKTRWSARCIVDTCIQYVHKLINEYSRRGMGGGGSGGKIK